MSKGLAAFDRIILFLLGLVLLASGLLPILMHFNVDFANEAARWVDHDTWGNLAQQPWFFSLLIGLTIVSALLGLWFIIANSRPRHFNRVDSPASNEDGDIRMQMSNLSGGIASSMEEIPGVISVDKKVSYDRARPTAEFTVTASPETNVESLRQHIDRAEADFRDAFENLDIDTVYRLHFERLQAVEQ